MYLRYVFILVVLGYGTPKDTVAQDDLSSWTTIQLNYNITEQWSLSLRPIMRHRDNLGAYNNTSIDFSVGYKLNKVFSASLLNRHFFIPDTPDREFIFLDLKAKQTLSPQWTLQHLLRYHFANNINDRIDPDFLRYQPKLVFGLKSHTKLFAMLDPFYRLTNPSSLAGARYELGYDRALRKGLGINLQYWYQKGYGNTPITTSHFIIVNLRKTFSNKTTDSTKG